MAPDGRETDLRPRAFRIRCAIGGDVGAEDSRALPRLFSSCAPFRRHMPEGVIRLAMKMTEDGVWWTVTAGPEDDGLTLGGVLRRRFQLSGRLYQRIVHAQAFRLNGRVSHTARTVHSGDVISVRIAPSEPYGVEPEPIPLTVVYEDVHYLIVDKPTGQLVHPIFPEGRGTLAAGVAHWLKSRGIAARVRPVNRLDRDTTGLVLFAKHALAHARADELLRGGRIERVYLAFVHGRPDPPEGAVELPIGRDPHHSMRRIVRDDGHPAKTLYRVRRSFSGGALVELRLITGRTHQIRVHMAHIGHPLFGDRLYGGREHPRAPLGRQALHAYRLAFPHPFQEGEIAVESPLPDDLRRLYAALEQEEPMSESGACRAERC